MCSPEEREITDRYRMVPQNGQLAQLEEYLPYMQDVKCSSHLLTTMVCENKKCGREHDGSIGSGRFCSRSCSNSRVWTEDTIRKKSLSALNSERVQIENRSRRKRKLVVCKTCGKNFECWICLNRIYCSNKCAKADIEVRRLVSLKISRKAKERYAKFPDQHPNRRCSHINESYPEKYFRDWLEKNGLVVNKHFKKQYKVGTYFIDFFIPSLDLCIEIDGERFHKRDEREIRRENFIKQNHSLIRFNSKPLVRGEFKSQIIDIIDKTKALVAPN